MKKRLLAVVALCALSAGCVFPRDVHVHSAPPGHAKRYAHVHGHSCGHVYVRGAWVVR